MSWGAYVDNLKQYPGVNAGIVAGLDTCSVYAQDGLEASGEELKKLKAFFSAPPNGRDPSVHVGGSKFLVLRSDDSSLEGKMKARCISVVKTNTLLIIAVHNAPDEEASDQTMAQKVTHAARNVADYLLKSSL